MLVVPVAFAITLVIFLVGWIINVLAVLHVESVESVEELLRFLIIF